MLWGKGITQSGYTRRCRNSLAVNLLSATNSLVRSHAGRCVTRVNEAQPEKPVSL